jgi:hypothetical protein
MYRFLRQLFSTRIIAAALADADPAQLSAARWAMYLQP